MSVSLANARPASASLHPRPGEAPPEDAPQKREDPREATRRAPITDRMVESVMALTIIELEQDLIPAQGAGRILYVYAQDHEITHDVRRTLEVFDGDMNEAIDSIRAFVIDGLIGDGPRPR